MRQRDLLKAMADAARPNLDDFDGKLKAALSLLASAGGAYVLGGIVMALRLAQADLPVQDALNVIPFSVLLVTGIRELIITAVVAVFLIGIMLALAAPRWMPDVVGFLVPAALLLVVPFNPSGLAWPAGLLVLAWVFLHLKRQAGKPGRKLALLPIATALLATVLGVTLLRYTGPPYRLPIGRVALKPADPNKKIADSTAGAYLAETSDFVYLAGTRTETSGPYVVGYARDRVLTLAILPPPQPKQPPVSLFGRIVGAEFAITPLLDVWSGGRYHGPRVFQ